MEGNKITVLIAVPGEIIRSADIRNSLAEFQDIIGGYPECVYPFEDDVGIIRNEDAESRGLMPNRALKDDAGNMYDMIYGSFLIVGLNDDDFGSLDDELLAKYQEQFMYPETLVQERGHMVPVPYAPDVHTL